MPKIEGPLKTPRKSRHYNAEWENLPEFKGWLGQSMDEEKGARCKLCQKNLRCHLFDIKKHSETKKHRDLAGDIPPEAYDALPMPRRQSIPLHAKGPRQASFLENPRIQTVNPHDYIEFTTENFVESKKCYY